MPTNSEISRPTIGELSPVAVFMPEKPAVAPELDFAILTAAARQRIAAHIRTSSVLQSVGLSGHPDTAVLVKHEAEQATGCFKERGAHNATLNYLEEGAERLYAPSAGSHSGGMARAAAQHNADFVGVMPRSAPPEKQALVTKQGGRVMLLGSTFDEAAEQALEQFAGSDRKLVHPFADPHVIAGQGTLAHELAEQTPDMTHLVVPAGGGGLAAGVASSLKRLLPDVHIIAAQVEGCTAFTDSLRTGRMVRAANYIPKIYGGIAVAKPHPLPLFVASRVVDSTIVVPSTEVYRAIQTIHTETGTLYEYAGGVAPAAAQVLSRQPAFAGSKIVAIATGANPPSHFGPLVSAVLRRQYSNSQPTPPTEENVVA